MFRKNAKKLTNYYITTQPRSDLSMECNIHRTDCFSDGVLCMLSLDSFDHILPAVDSRTLKNSLLKHCGIISHMYTYNPKQQ